MIRAVHARLNPCHTAGGKCTAAWVSNLMYSEGAVSSGAALINRLLSTGEYHGKRFYKLYLLGEAAAKLFTSDFALAKMQIEHQKHFSGKEL